jgi:lysophospholipase L1-like esterase
MRSLARTAFLALAVVFAISALAQTPDVNAPIQVQRYQAPVRVACVGDSITAGSGTKVRELESYPAQLQRMLDEHTWLVGNFGVSGATLMNRGDKPYQKLPVFQDALKFDPDVVIVMLGTNDSKPQNWHFKEQFVADYRDLLGRFKALPKVPRIFICRPVVVIGAGAFGINGDAVAQELPLIDAIAKDAQVGVIDMRGALASREDLLPDHVHPNTEGANLLARAAYRALTGGEFVGTLAPVVHSEGKILVVPQTPPRGDEAPWNPDCGDGTYRNPVLFADYSDPDAIRVGDDFYLVASSFHDGARSADPALEGPRQLDDHQPRAAAPGAGRSFLRAPSRRGRVGPGDPPPRRPVLDLLSGPRLRHLPHHRPGSRRRLDPARARQGRQGPDRSVSILGRRRADVSHPRLGVQPRGISNRLTLHKLSPDGTKVIDAGTTIIDGVKLPGWRTIEGPKLYRRHGYYYVFAPAGGVSDGYQAVFRAKNIYGPYEPRIVLAQGSTAINGPHQGAWVDTPTGEDWFLHFNRIRAHGPRRSPPADGLARRRLAGHGQRSGGHRQRRAGARARQAQRRAHLSGRGAANLRRVRGPGARPPMAVERQPAAEWARSTRAPVSSAWPASVRRRRATTARRPRTTATMRRISSCKSFPHPSSRSRRRSSLRRPPRARSRAWSFSATITPCSVCAARRTACVSCCSSTRARTGRVRKSAKRRPWQRRMGRCICASPWRRTRTAGSPTAPTTRPSQPMAEPFQGVGEQWTGAKVGLVASAPTSAVKTGHADFDWFRVRPVSD